MNSEDQKQYKKMAKNMKKLSVSIQSLSDTIRLVLTKISCDQYSEKMNANKIYQEAKTVDKKEAIELLSEYQKLNGTEKTKLFLLKITGEERLSNVSAEGISALVDGLKKNMKSE